MTTFARWNSRSLLGVVTLVALLVAAIPARSAEGTYHFLKEIPVGGEGGWDYLSVDSAARRLYVTHGSKVVVIDLDKELDPKTHRIYLAAAKVEPTPAAAPGAPRQRPKMVPGSFKVLVYAP